MNPNSVKNTILNPKILLLVIFILLTLLMIVFIQKQNSESILHYQFQFIPDIELKNTLQEIEGAFYGEVNGFVKFDNIQSQPKELKQYYIIKPLNKFNKDLSQYFSIEEIIKMNYLPPKSIGKSELVEVNETYNIITLEDENGNQFFINKATQEVSTRDSSGDNATLITNNSDFKELIQAGSEY